MNNMKLKLWSVLSLAIALSASVSFAEDETTTNGDDIQALKQEIQHLEQKVDKLEHKQEQDHAAVTNATKPTAKLTVGQDGVIFTSANSNFVAGLHAWVQVDSRTFFENHNIGGIDGFLLRRARIILQGTVYQNFDYNFTPEFAGNSPQILDAFLNYHYDPAVQLQAGKFKPPIGLEALEPDIYTFFNERSLATDLVPYRSIGTEFHGDALGGTFSYAAGIFNGLPDYNTSTINTNFDNDMAFAGRVFTLPFKQTSVGPLKGLGFGVSGDYEHDRGTAAALTPGYTTDGQEKFFTYSAGVVGNGAHWRVSPQGYYYYGPLGFMGEYVVSDQQVTKTTAPTASATIRNTAWEVSAGWVLTGEDDSYNGVTPAHPFSIQDGGWGAWQIVGRFAELDVDSDAFPLFASPTASASGAKAWSAGLNWYLNRNLRANLSFSHTWFAGNAGANPVTSQPENVLFTRMQLAF
jgi:phosphate-selective porin OprO/OprP